jgi:hypothetical protein
MTPAPELTCDATDEGLKNKPTATPAINPRHNVLDLLYLKRRGLSLRLRRTEGSEPQLRRAGREEV